MLMTAGPGISPMTSEAIAKPIQSCRFMLLRYRKVLRQAPSTTSRKLRFWPKRSSARLTLGCTPWHAGRDKRGQRLAPRRQCRKGWIRILLERNRYAKERPRTGQRDVRLRETRAHEPPVGISRVAPFDLSERPVHLAAAALEPWLVPLLCRPEDVLVDLLATLLGRPDSERHELQHLASPHAVRRHERARRPHDRVQVIQDRGRLREDRAVIEHERRHSPEWTVSADLLVIGSYRPVRVLKRKLEELERHSHPPHKRGVEHSDQQHDASDQ